jgi:tripartite-type tricarboxylate transporter receptor subunit TctC
MKIQRRRFLCLAAAAATVPVLPRMARAQAYPSRPVRIVTGFTPGGSGDLLARLFGQWLSERFGQPFVIENRPGGGGNIATESVARAPADGHTLLTIAPSSTINATLYSKLSFNLIRDFTPVASFIRQPHVLVVNPSFPPQAIPEIIAYAKANPGKISTASPGTGTGPHMAGELFKMMAGIDMVHVPYRGIQPALTDLIAGRVQVSFPGIAPAIGHIRNGTLRPLAVTTASRWRALPDIPTIGEFVPGYEASTWFGIVAPASTPAKIVHKLNSAINAGLADRKVAARLDDLGGGVFATAPAEFGRFIAGETEKWGKVVRALDIKV